MRGEQTGHTLQPTAVAHEAYLRLSRQRGALVTQRAQFLSAAAYFIRRVLIDHARARERLKRGRGWSAVPLEGLPAPANSNIDLLALEEALEELQTLNARHARVVELRFYGDLDITEVASVLGVSTRTVNNDWRGARAWLAHRLASKEPQTNGA